MDSHRSIVYHVWIGTRELLNRKINKPPTVVPPKDIRTDQSIIDQYINESLLLLSFSMVNCKEIGI